MKLIAKARLSGAFGVRERGEEFTVDAKSGAELIERGVAHEAPAAPVAKPAKAAAEKS